MRTIVRSCIIAGLFSTGMSAAGCSDEGADYRTAPRVSAPTDQQALLASARFENAGPVTSITRESFVDRVGLFNGLDWPSSISERRWRAGSAAATEASSSSLVFDDLNTNRGKSSWTTAGGRRYCFFGIRAMSALMPRVGGAAQRPADNSHTLAYIADKGSDPQIILLDNVMTDGYVDQLCYDVAPISGGVLVVFASVDGLFQVIGRVSRDTLVFSPPQRIHDDGRLVRSVQVRASGMTTHVVWTTCTGTGFDADLSYMRSTNPTDPNGGWSSPLVISSSALSRSADIVVDKNEVHLSWSDHRFRTGLRRKINGAKLFMQRSADGGESFAEPVLLSDEGDESDLAERTRLFPTDTGLLVLWQRDSDFAMRQWNAATIDRNLDALTMQGKVSQEALRQAFANRMTTIMARPVSGWKQLAGVDAD